MLRSFLAVSTLLFVSSLMYQSTVRLEIKALPEYHPSGSDIYIAGSFNGWNPQDKNYQFQRNDKGEYYFDMKLDDGEHEYKITRGDWDNAECKKGGAGIENRILPMPANTPGELNIEEWADRFATMPKKSTASKNVHIIDTAFLIPQLKRTRRVWIYLPQGYGNSKNRYPVLYMQDGQNVFDDATSYAGEWGVDEYLDSTRVRNSIVVAIDNGGNKRMNEYNPYDTDRFGKGEGNEYVDFIVNTLKPFIDKRYKTRKDKEHTYIAGSSMGGLISLYAVLKYPKIFGGVGVFSPAFRFSGSKIYDDIKRMGKKVNSNIFFYCGKLEGESMVPDMMKAFDGMTLVSKSKMKKIIRDDGKHDEPTWRKEFPEGYKWMVYGQEPTPARISF